MRKGPFRVEPLANHDRSVFRSGTSALDDYFASRVTQDVRRRMTSCFVAVEIATDAVVGYYTLASASIPVADIPEPIARKLPRYPSISAIRLGRLAVDHRYHGQGLGGALLVDAAGRCLRTEVAAFAIFAEAKNEAAVGFYEHHGFLRLVSQPKTLFLPLATAAQALSR